MRAAPLGDAALLLELGAEIDPALNARVHALAVQLLAAPLPGVSEVTPAYTSLLVHYDPLLLDYADVRDWALAQAERSQAQVARPARVVEVPVRYGGADGPDLDFVAQHCGLTPAGVVRLHCAAEYRVYMMGFTPGFAYLGGLDARLAAPRLETPRTLIPAGSVGIAGMQTGIYPLDSPGGWRLIGRTSLRLFDPAADPPCLLAPGDVVKFVNSDP